MVIPYVIDRRKGGERERDIFSTMLDERTVFLTGEVNDDMASAIVAELLFLEATDPKKPINMYINSPGGEVTAGLAIYDTMRHIRCKVHTLCVGQACSMGAVLFSAGDERSVLPSARIMIHQPSGGAQGMQSDIMITAKEITRIREQLYDILARHTGQTKEKIEEDCDRDYFMSAEEAVSYGIADNVIEFTDKTDSKEKRV